MEVQAFMTPASGAAACSVSAGLAPAVETLKRLRQDCIVVLGEDKIPVGIISLSQLVLQESSILCGVDLTSTLPAEWLQSAPPVDRHFINVGASVQEASSKMCEQDVRHLFVLDGGAWVGVLSAHDLMKALLASSAQPDKVSADQSPKPVDGTHPDKASANQAPKPTELKTRAQLRAETIQQYTRTPLLLLHLLFIGGWYGVLAFADDGFGYMLAKGLGMSAVVGSVHNLNAFLLWCGMQRTRAKLEARVRGQEAPQVNPRAAVFVGKSSMSILRFFLIPLTVSMYSMTIARNPDNFRLLYPASKASPEGLYHVEICLLIMMLWVVLSKASSALAVALAQRSARQDEAGDVKVVTPRPTWTDTVRRHTDVGYQLLWTLCIYWLYIVAVHVKMSTLGKIPVSALICALVGASLNINGLALWRVNKMSLDTLRTQLKEKVSDSSAMLYVTINSWTCFRFFFVPFCVSSYSIVMSEGGDEFVYLFPVGFAGPLPHMALAVMIVCTFLSLSQIIRFVSLKAPKSAS